MPLAPGPGRLSLDLTIRPGGLHLHLGGTLTGVDALRLHRVLRRLEGTSALVHVHLAHGIVVDADGVAPLVASIVRRRTQDLPDLRIHAVDRTVLAGLARAIRPAPPEVAPPA